MTIECLKFKNGYPIGPEGFDFENNALIMAVKRKNKDLVQILSKGKYDLTPTCLTHLLVAHTLIVNEDGTGTYIQAPRSMESADTSTTGVNPSVAREVRLPQDQSWAMVLGPSIDGHSLASIYTIVLYSHSRDIG